LRRHYQRNSAGVYNSREEAAPNEAGNVFVAASEPLIVVRWISDTHLSISGGGASGAFKADKSFQGVDITYD